MIPKQCGGCKQAIYCSRRCQSVDWYAGHMLDCQLYRSGDIPTRKHHLNLLQVARTPLINRHLNSQSDANQQTIPDACVGILRSPIRKNQNASSRYSEAYGKGTGRGQRPKRVSSIQCRPMYFYSESLLDPKAARPRMLRANTIPVQENARDS